ncbi:hypothetical protein L1887_31805 [Cichorium endivia]|nr:hypothetical protein L1887_31805 [Cichorium endivia]
MVGSARQQEKGDIDRGGSCLVVLSSLAIIYQIPEFRFDPIRNHPCQRYPRDPPPSCLPSHPCNLIFFISIVRVSRRVF